MDSVALIAAVIAAFIVLGVIFYQQTLIHKTKVQEARALEKIEGLENDSGKLRVALESAVASKQTADIELQDIREESAKLRTSLSLERKQFDEKLGLLEHSKDQLSVAFKNIANEIFDDKTKKFEANSKANLSSVLSPLQEKISQFEKRVEETYDKESKERFSLAREIKSLQELNVRISEEAVNLTNALKGDNKAQGSWGELVLETILEKSGLVKGREYEVQVSLKSEEGVKYQPDVIVHLPESRDIIIDSKVSLKAWDAFCSKDDDTTKAELLKQHIQSLRSHVKLLSEKDYQNLTGVNSLDYVFLFMPIESAYGLAIQKDPDLLQYAFERNIIFVVPTTLLMSLRTVQNLWRLAQQNQNAQEIANKAGALYDKFVAFVEDLDDIGYKIEASKKSFDKAHNKLVSGRGNLVKRAESLKELGAKTAKKQKSNILDSSRQNDALLASDELTVADDTKNDY
ncbi:MAG TPA: DNA recombination protein RmuC [Gammaproteobacteria bacterium]|nr:DNA recombination protein RmuC [Gammaproteobacteria bacterium]